MNGFVYQPEYALAGYAPPRAPLRRRGVTRPPGGAEFARLVQAVAAARDRSAFARLYEHFAPRVKSYLLRLGAGAGQAEELAQEALLSVWAKAAYFDPEKASVATWVFTIARNLHIDARRRERTPGGMAAGLEVMLEEAAPAQDAADMLLMALEQQERLRSAVLTLPADQAEVVRLCFFQDKPHAEIERELGIPLGTVKSRLRLALARLRRLLDAQI
ncbi:RNA polymerase sigma factor [Acidocella aquatica]|uniref:RNA polymerase sigma factor n=1 Tax=Acidocella aquatica TaxID=1922313 RepID=A0ABQ6A3F5_9PROT|nr:sigma-70 family RNA polymerase sigma factor [Acidocella aquatica]GLR67014.1 RNA polymerase sigma factor [Acidocella aquatica]